VLWAAVVRVSAINRTAVAERNSHNKAMASAVCRARPSAARVSRGV